MNYPDFLLAYFHCLAELSRREVGLRIFVGDSLCLVLIRCLDPNTCGGNLRVIWVAKPSGNKGVRESLTETHAKGTSA
jgi:hypothetical protein